MHVITVDEMMIASCHVKMHECMQLHHKIALIYSSLRVHRWTWFGGDRQTDQLTERTYFGYLIALRKSINFNFERQFIFSSLSKSLRWIYAKKKKQP